MEIFNIATVIGIATLIALPILIGAAVFFAMHNRAANIAKNVFLAGMMITVFMLGYFVCIITPIE